MNEQRVDVKRLAELLAKATPGPWVVQGHSGLAFGPADEIYVAQCFYRTGYYAKDGDVKEDGPNNAALIAEGITALPALLRQLAEQAAAEDAALPELPEQLLEILSDLDTGSVHYNQALCLIYDYARAARQAQGDEQ